jgi:hypothetical protein
MADPFPDKITIGEKYGPAMEITDQAEADRYFERCVEHMMRHGHDRNEAERIERGNLGYFAGYYGDETRARVERLFRCAHRCRLVVQRCGRHALRMGEEAGKDPSK